jgi:SAM-dependent methyltransferase
MVYNSRSPSVAAPWQFVPVPVKRLAERLVWSATRGSTAFWELHYRARGTSGPGSRGSAAAFKAAETNRIVMANGVRSVVEFGCGDGYQLGLLAVPRYVGLDVSPRVLSWCIERYGADASKTFLRYDPTCWHDRLRLIHADLALSMDVILHLVEPDVFEKYMTDLFAAADRFVLIYSSNDEAYENRFTRHRRFTDWVSVHEPHWRLTERVDNPEPGGADFYLYSCDGDSRASLRST